MAETALQRTYRDKAQAQQNALAPMLVETLGGLMPQIPNLLPVDITTEQFRSGVFLELSGRPQLADCTPNSIRDVVLKAAMYGLLPGRDCHFLPFKDSGRGGKVATFVPNYAGVLLSLDRTGRVEDAFTHPVYEGDEFVCDHLARNYSHVPSYARTPPRVEGKARLYYACIVLKGTKKPHVEVMTLTQIEAVKRRSPAHESGPWGEHFDEMARKTVLKRAAKMIKGAAQLHTLLQEEEERERQDIPEVRHMDNISALFTDGSGAAATAGRSTPPASPVLPSEDEVSRYMAQIEEAVQEDGGNLKAWYVWAQNRYKTDHSAYTHDQWEEFVQSVRAHTISPAGREGGKDAPRTAQETLSPSKAPATRTSGLRAQERAKTGGVAEEPFHDQETGELLQPGLGAVPPGQPGDPTMQRAKEDDEGTPPQDVSE